MILSKLLRRRERFYQDDGRTGCYHGLIIMLMQLFRLKMRLAEPRSAIKERPNFSAVSKTCTLQKMIKRAHLFEWSGELSSHFRARLA